jgi:hypothetical protein
MAKAKRATTLRKPVLSRAEVLQFAEKRAARSSAATAAKGEKSGLVPVGDTRMTANVREDLHLKLKIRAAQERTTVGELIERWIEGWK